MEAFIRFLPHTALRAADSPLALAREATWPLGCGGRRWQVGGRGWSASLWLLPACCCRPHKAKGPQADKPPGIEECGGSFAHPPHCWQTVSCWSSAGRGLGCRSLRWHHPPGGLVSELSLLRTLESCWVGGSHLSLFAR